jgi:ABC-type sugar transport system substrate-binding protein
LQEEAEMGGFCVRRVLAGLLLLTTLGVVAACGGGGEESSATAPAATEATTADTGVSSEPADTGGAAGGETFPEAEVTAASDPWECKPVYAVPKSAAGTKLAFINPGPADPYVAAWSAGMKAAADFYGVDLQEAFIGNYDYSKIVDSYRSLAASDPEVVGALADEGTGKALQAAVEADGRKLVFIDTEIPGVPQVGLQNAEGGRIEGEHLQEAVVPLLDGPWKDRPIVIVTVSAQGCVVCDQRVDAALEVIKGFLPADANVKEIRVAEPTATVDVIQPRMRDIITANPDAVFIVATLDDESGGGTYNAIKQAGIEDDARLATIGGDNLAVSNMQEGSPTYVASVDAKPFCEAWNWVEAAIATKNGEEFAPYPFTGVITPENVKDYEWRLDITF